MNIIKVPIQVPLSLAQEFGEPGMKSFDDFKKSIEHSIHHRYLVRLSHDITEAILATVEEQGINTMIVDFSFLRNNRKLLSLSTCDIIGVKLRGDLEKDLSNIVVSYDKGRHSNLGLEIANALSKYYKSNIRIIRGVVEPPEVELEILNKINEMMFDLELKKIPFEKVYPSSSDIVSGLLENFAKKKSEIVIAGAGNQADQAFSPKTLEIVDKSKKTVFVVRNHRFSVFRVRTFWGIISSHLRENRHLYRLYIEALHLAHLLKAKRERGRYDEEYFESKIS